MAKTTGLGDNFYVGGYDISGDTNSLSKIDGNLAVQDVTDITQSANARLGLLRAGEIDFEPFFDPGANAEHVALSPLPTSDVVCSYFRGTVLGNPAASLVAKQINYDWTRAATGELTGSVQMQSNGFGLEWGVQLTAGKRTDTGATAGGFVDLGTNPGGIGGGGGGYINGAQAYLQVFSFTGTDVTVAVQHSTTSGGAYTNVTGLGFTQITGGAPLTQRVATANNLTINEFVKVTTTTTGGFSSLVFAVQLTPNPVLVNF